jgi:hypothetical protein
MPPTPAAPIILSSVDDGFLLAGWRVQFASQTIFSRELLFPCQATFKGSVGLIAYTTTAGQTFHAKYNIDFDVESSGTLAVPVGPLLVGGAALPFTINPTAIDAAGFTGTPVVVIHVVGSGPGAQIRFNVENVVVPSEQRVEAYARIECPIFQMTLTP